MKSSKLLLTLVSLMTSAALCFALSSSAFAAEEKTETSSDQSKNPITGTVKHTKKYRHKKAEADGSKSETKETVTHKTKTDGSTETDVEKESSTAPADK